MSLNFITDENLKKHIKDTISQYTKTLENMNLTRFNSNLIDPVKLLFDQKISDKSFEDIIKLEIQRQRDKTNSNIVGYFHQNIFKYILNCEVPKKGFDIIYTDSSTNQKLYVELKNKHNTMNSSSSLATYMKMQDHIIQNSNDICCLVEVIASTSQNIPWKCTFKGQQYLKENIRRISIDKFYEIATGEKDAFYQLCQILPTVIQEILTEEQDINFSPKDTVLQELVQKNPDILKALYKLAFESYNGFEI